MSAARCAAAILLAWVGVVRGEPSTNDVASGAATSAPPAIVRPPPALMAVALGAGTAALILSGHDGSKDADEGGEDGLAAPELESPPPGVDIVDGGGSVTLAWRPVEEAAAYLVDVDACDGTNNVCADYELEKTPALTLVVAVPSPFAGRWRVRAVDAQDIAGPYSDFRAFTYRGPLPLP
jgi:hypothetical protein